MNYKTVVDWIRKKKIFMGTEKIVVRNVSGFWFRQKWFFSKINEKQVVFCAYLGNNYACSPRAIYEAMLKNKNFRDYKFIWVFKKNCIEKYKYLKENTNTELVIYEGSSFEKAFATSRYIVINSRLPIYFSIRKTQIVLQCWHGTPLKKLGYDIVKGDFSLFSTAELRYSYKITAQQLTHFLSPSKFASEKFITAFNLKNLNRENCILELGYPRNDFLFNYTQNDVMKIKKQLNIPLNKKICFYAPTWRDNQHISGVGYSFFIPLDFDQLRQNIGDEYVVIFRPHYFIASQFDFTKYEGFIYNGADIDDINYLYIISDVLITDYSSVFFDFANLKRPIIFYMYDLEEYKNNLRDFYLELDDLPGSIVQTQQELTKAILRNELCDKMSIFNNTYNYLDDGCVSNRVIERIINN